MPIADSWDFGEVYAKLFDWAQAYRFDTEREECWTAVLQVCRQSRTLSDAGRQLFQASRAQRTVVNDADWLRKYLARFGLDWERLTSASFPSWLGRRH